MEEKEKRKTKINKNMKKIKTTKIMGHLDIICGGQFGDEGKGAVSSWLITNQGYKFSQYDFTVRVGGYNAEHRFVHAGKDYLCRILPCGLAESSIKLYLGAGHLFSIDALNQEIRDMKIDSARIFIDENAGIVTDIHMGQSLKANRTKRGGTTGQGAGKAATHKVLRDGEFLVAKDYKELKSMITNVAGRIRQDLNEGKIGLLEGSQGALISLNHGYYPFNCAKDTTPAGILAETGATIQDVNDIYVIYRSYPMRVPGASGPTRGEELSWEELEKRLGQLLPESTKRQTQPDGSKGLYERIFEWSWEDFDKSLILTGPTKMILTFADWHNPKNLGVKSWKDIQKDTKIFISQMEERAFSVLQREAAVVLVRTGPGEGDFTKVPVDK